MVKPRGRKAIEVCLFHNYARSGYDRAMIALMLGFIGIFGVGLISVWRLLR